MPVAWLGCPQLAGWFTKMPTKTSCFGDPLNRGPPRFPSQVERPPVNGPVQMLWDLNRSPCNLSQSALGIIGKTALCRIFLRISLFGQPINVASWRGISGCSLMELTKSALKVRVVFKRSKTKPSVGNLTTLLSSTPAICSVAAPAKIFLFPATTIKRPKTVLGE